MTDLLRPEEFSAPSADGLDISLMGRFRRCKRADMHFLAVDHRPGAKFSLQSSDAFVRAAVSFARIVAIEALVCLSQIFPSVIIRMAISMVDAMGRVISRHHLPDDAMNKKSLIFNAYDRIPVEPFGPDDFPSKPSVCGVALMLVRKVRGRSFLPPQFPVLRVVGKAIYQPLGWWQRKNFHDFCCVSPMGRCINEVTA